MIVIYGKPDCQYCTKAKSLVEDRGLAYEYIDISVGDAKQELLTRKPDAKMVPQIWWHNRHIGGYNELVNEIENTIGGYGDGKI